MPITHVDLVTVYVSDQEKALDFYTNKLGFEVVRDNPMGPDLRWIQVRPPGGEASLVLAHGFGGEYWEESIGRSGCGLQATDIVATCEAMASRGVEFVEMPTAQYWGMMQAIFKDPDGNTFVLSEPLPSE